MRAAVIVALVLLSATAPRSSAEIYRWVDAEGRMHFTQDLSQVPPSQRAAAQAHAATPRSERLQTYPGSEESSHGSAARRNRPGEVLRIPFAKRGDMMVVQVTLNDELSAPFLVDTGASDVSIPAALASRLGIRIGPDTPHQRYTTANGIITKPVITLDSVQAGDARLEQVRASISSTMEIGLLGGAFFNNFTFQIDPAANVIAVVLNDRVRAGRSETQWRQNFQRIRADIARLEHYVDQNNFTRATRVAELDAKRAELERQLEALEEEANRADVPQAWRD